MDSVPSSPGPLGTAYSARLRATWRRTSLLPATFLRAMLPLRWVPDIGPPVEPPDYRSSGAPSDPGGQSRARWPEPAKINSATSLSELRLATSVFMYGMRTQRRLGTSDSS